MTQLSKIEQLQADWAENARGHAHAPVRRDAAGVALHCRGDAGSSGTAHRQSRDTRSTSGPVRVAAARNARTGGLLF